MPAPVTVRAATYNILHGMRTDDGSVDLAAVSDTVASLGAHVVAVQEVDRGLERSGGVDQVAGIAAALGWHGVFAPALLGDPDRSWTTASYSKGGPAAPLRPPARDRGGPAYGVGLLSPVPLSGVAAVPLPGGRPGRRRRPARPQRPGWDFEPRVALGADVAVGGVRVRLMTTHLSYLPWRAIAQLRRAVAAAGGGPAVLLGDLNLPSAVVRTFAGRAWAAAGGPPTYPAWQPRTRIDHVLVRGGAVTGATVGPTGTSDHLPLLAIVEFTTFT